MVHPSALLQALGALFESLWARALPLALIQADVSDVDTSDRPNRDKARLLTLLTTDLPDVVIARQLGRSYRTYQRRPHKLIKPARRLDPLPGRVRAAQLGWIPRPTATDGAVTTLVRSACVSDRPGRD